MNLELLESKIISNSLSEVAREAGKSIMSIYGAGFSVTMKGDQSPLTEADKCSHTIISNYLKRTSPFPLLSEEGKEIAYEERKKWNQFWLVDPLDGTKEFVKRNDEFTVNIALIKDGKPVEGVIYVPAKDILYFAAKGKGAYKQEHGLTSKLPINKASQHLTVVGSRSHGSRDFEDYMSTLEQRHHSVELITAGSSLKFCLVAEGRADLYPRLGPTMEWDTAAGQIIVEEAGGRVLELPGMSPLSYNKESLLNPHFIADNWKHHISG